jgi:outer membrane DcaP-like protein
MRKTSLALTLAVSAAVASMSAVAATDAERIQQLEGQLEQQQRLLEQQQQTLEAMQQELQRIKGDQISTTTVRQHEQPLELEASAVVQEETDSAPAGLDFDIYGFVMADAIYDFKRVDPDWNDTLRVTTIPTQDGLYGEDGEFVFSVRQSRLGFAADYDTPAGKVTALLEAELFGTGGDAGQTTPRLRHAWVTWKNLGMGQYWSNFMDIDVFPNTIDYWGPTGMVFYRNQQVRYTFPMGEDEFSIALENPDTALTVGKFRDECAAEEGESCESVLDDVIQKYNNVPDLSVRYRNNTDWGHWQLAGIARELGYERLDTGSKDSEFGWGVNASTVINTFGMDKLKLQLVYGEGIGNYMNDGGVDLAPKDAQLEGNSAEAVPLLGLVAYYDHYWSEQWSTSVGWSSIKLDTTKGQSGSEFETGQIAQINLLHYPTNGVMIGGELIWGEREDVSGDDGYDLRAQLSLKVNFPRE